MEPSADVRNGRNANISSVIELSLTTAAPSGISRNVETRESLQSQSAVEALGALAQEHRLILFRMLVRAGAKGMAAGAIAEALSVPNSSLSFHLTQLRKAGLILQERHHRSLIYRANYPAMNALLAFLTENCCAGTDCGVEPACEATAAERRSA
jgi:DNA-binding transcriptional ArsR family regulator